MSSGWEGLVLGPGQKLGLCSDCGLGWAEGRGSGSSCLEELGLGLRIKLGGAWSGRFRDRARVWGARAGMSSALRSDWEERGKGGSGARVGRSPDWGWRWDLQLGLRLRLGLGLGGAGDGLG